MPLWEETAALPGEPPECTFWRPRACYPFPLINSVPTPATTVQREAAATVKEEGESSERRWMGGSGEGERSEEEEEVG